MSGTPSHYVHGTDPEEQHRLSLLNDLLNRGSLRELALAGGEKVLDLGCGLGQLSRVMADAAGLEGRVLGIDRSREQLAEARRRAQETGGQARVEFREGDVLALALEPGEWGSFDVAHTRFLLEHVPRPVEDEDHDILRLWPEPAGFERVWRAYIESYVRNGNDPYVGRKLTALLREAGAAPRRNAAIWFGSSAGEPMFPVWVENLLGVLRGARESVMASGRVDATSFDAALAATREWGGRPDASSWYFMAYAEGVREG